MTYWWTADQHFDHSNMIGYMDRPYEDVEEMNEDIIATTNSYVAKGDLLIIAGDVTLHHKAELVYTKFINRLNGTKILVKGNHDYWMGKGKGRYIYHKKIGDTFTVTSHYAMRVWNRSHRGSINLHGHSHGSLDPWKNQLDVGVDNAFKLLGEYRPFNLDEILHFIKLNSDMNLWSSIIQKSAQHDHHEGMDRYDNPPVHQLLQDEEESK